MVPRSCRAPAVLAAVVVAGCGNGVGILLGEVSLIGQSSPPGAADGLAGLAGLAGVDAQAAPDDSSTDSNTPVADTAADSGTIVDDSSADSGTFGAPVLVSDLVATGYLDYKETLTADRLEIYFISDRPGGPGNQDVWQAKRASATDPWGIPTCVVEVSSPLHETGPAVSPDGLTLWISSDRAGGKGGYDIWVSTRPTRSTPTWSTPKDVAELNTVGDEFPRAPIQSALVMPPSYREKLPNNQFQTFLTSRVSVNAPWAAPTRLSEVDTADIDTDGFLTDDQLVLYFSTDRAIVGDQDLYVARRSSPAAPFTSFDPISELNTTHQERDPWVSPDGHEIYFSSDRGGTLQIYHATR
ncbi:MAG TPA: hypothetical protein VN894_08200 [Polyangiaceae bacterium]|nr:hypothetical protein [Polyangiaceae bacterium]